MDIGGLPLRIILDGLVSKDTSPDLSHKSCLHVSHDHCDHCSNPIPPSAGQCPHCGKPGLYPNVRKAESGDERSALRARYEASVADLEARGAAAEGAAFEKAVEESRAVIARSLSEFIRLATSDNELYATFYQLLEAEVRVPSGGKWDVVRAVTDEALFPGYKKQIRFAALSLTSGGLENYGDCSLVLRDEMISHRATVFEENSAVWMDRYDVRIAEADDLPLGYRAVWDEREKLAVAKLGSRVTAGMSATEFSRILFVDGADTGSDEFIEVHIYGPMTIRTLERIRVVGRKAGIKKARWKAIEEKLRQFGVELEVEP